MKWSELKEQLKKLFGDSPEKQKLIDDIQIDDDDPKPDAKPGDIEIPPAIKSMFDAMKGENDKLFNELQEIRKKEKERDEAMKEKSEKEFAEKVEAKLKKAIEDGKIPAKNEDLKKQYKSILEKDFENGEKIIEALPAQKKQTGDGKDEPESQSINANPAKPIDRGKLINEVSNAFKSN